MKIDRDAIWQLSKDLRRPVETLVALSSKHDPFYIGADRLVKAEWVAALYRDHGFGAGVHLRRNHYRLVSQSPRVKMPDGTDYLNTEGCSYILQAASKAARYLGLVDAEDFVDRRNPDPDVRLPNVVAPPNISTYSLDLSVALPDAVPYPHASFNADRPTPYHVEIWAEKNAINEVLEPLADQYGLNRQTAAGEMSTTHCRQLVERASANGGRPVWRRTSPSATRQSMRRWRKRPRQSRSTCPSRPTPTNGKTPCSTAPCAPGSVRPTRLQEYG